SQQVQTPPGYPRPQFDPYTHSSDLITNLAGTATNAVLSGLFFDPTASPPPPTTASLVKRDATTQGNWIGAYGAQGYNVIGNAASERKTPSVNSNHRPTLSSVASPKH